VKRKSWIVVRRAAGILIVIACSVFVGEGQTEETHSAKGW
jgi:hypothetical protein